MIAGSIMGSMMKTDLKDSLKKINWKLFVALLVMGLCPTVYTTFRTFLLGQLPGEWSYSILGCQQLYLGVAFASDQSAGGTDQAGDRKKHFSNPGQYAGVPVYHERHMSFMDHMYSAL